MCQDKNLIQTYNEKRDLYATIASSIFKKTYWECMEHWEDGSANPIGKEIRSKAKSIVLGIMYGMGAKLLASILGVSIEECRGILDEFYKMFPAVREFTLLNEHLAKTRGYVEDYLGRRRHLPDASLEEIVINAKKSVITNSDVCIDCNREDCKIDIPDEELTRIWTERWKEFQESRRYTAKKEFKELAKSNGIDFYDNGAFISKTLTQCTNSRIQGGASSLTKKAMVSIYNDNIMRELGFRILLPVHDELLGECPIENAEAVEKRLSELMIEAGKPECSVDMKVDTYVVKHWYADDVSNKICTTYNKMLQDGLSADDARSNLCSLYSELGENTVKQMCEGTFDVLSDAIC